MTRDLNFIQNFLATFEEKYIPLHSTCENKSRKINYISTLSMKYIKPLTFYIDLDLSCQPIMASGNVDDNYGTGLGAAADIHINIWDDEEIIDDNTIN